MKKCTFVLLIGLFPFVLQCGSKEDKVAAKVGEKKITIGDLEEAWAKLPGRETMTKKQILLTLIDKELLVLEAQKMNLDQDDQIVQKLEKTQRAEMMKAFDRSIAGQVSLSEEEMHRYFEESGMKSKIEVRASHIMVETSEEAKEILEQLGKGADFAQLAKERSIDRDTAEKGGDLGYWEQGVMVGPSVQKVFSMKVGEISEPFLNQRGIYHIFKKRDERPVGFEKQRPKIEQILKRKKVREKKAAYLGQVKRDLKFEINRHALDLLLEKGKSTTDNLPNLSAEDQAKTLFSYEGGKAGLGQHLRHLRKLTPNRRPAAGDSAQVVQFIERTAVTSLLHLEALYRKGFGQTEEMQAYLAKKKEALMVTELRRREVEENVITDQAIREYYEEHLKNYMEEVAITVQAMFVKDKKTAQELLDKIRKGADMAQLAQQQPLFFPEQGKNYAIFSLRSSDKNTPKLGWMARAAEAANEGELVGPTEVPFRIGKRSLTGYTLFRVLKKESARQKTLRDPKVRRSVERRLRGEKAQQIKDLFQRFLARLRQEYAGQIILYEEILEAFEPSPPPGT